MFILRKIEDLFQKRKTVILIFFLLAICQLIYSFLFPSYDAANPYWKNIAEMGLMKNYPFDSFSNSIAKNLYFFLPNYHINLDSAAHILLAHDFPQQYFQGNHTFLNRPLYAFLVFLVSRPLHLISDSYALTFAAGIFLNFILFLLTIFLFYQIVQKIISQRVAFLSSILLIFSPFTHIWLVQPETNIFGAFAVIFSLYLLYNYAVSPSLKKLIIFSLAIGLLMLGKMLFAITFFILLLAIFTKRYKEGFLFLIIHLIPVFLWYLIVTKVFGFTYYSGEMTDFNLYLINGWLFNFFELPWYKIFQIFLNTLPFFITSLFYGFLAVPVILALIGFREISLKIRNFAFIFILSFFVLFFIMDYYTPRHAFLMFPVIYPLSILGIDRIANFLKRYKYWYSLVFYLAIFVFLIIISNINIFKIFPYDSGSPWRL